ncbi:Uncharacterised protein [Halioglobus japonicus]|nr:Uncharacterised protein [Halioglobus japonicus]
MMHTNDTAKAPQSTGTSVRRVAAFTVLLTALASGCAMNETQERTGAGAAIGALGGAILGTSRESAAIGAAVGAAGGYIYDQYNKREDADAENARLQQENDQLKQEAAGSSDY